MTSYWRATKPHWHHRTKRQRYKAQRLRSASQNLTFTTPVARTPLILTMSGNTTDEQFKKTTQQVNPSVVTDHNINDEYMKNPPDVSLFQLLAGVCDTDQNSKSESRCRHRITCDCTTEPRSKGGCPDHWGWQPRCHWTPRWRASKEVRCWGINCARELYTFIDVISSEEVCVIDVAIPPTWTSMTGPSLSFRL